jgi:hypothetical protein
MEIWCEDIKRVYNEGKGNFLSTNRHTYQFESLQDILPFWAGDRAIVAIENNEIKSMATLSHKNQIENFAYIKQTRFFNWEHRYYYDQTVCGDIKHDVNSWHDFIIVFDVEMMKDLQKQNNIERIIYFNQTTYKIQDHEHDREYKNYLKSLMPGTIIGLKLKSQRKPVKVVWGYEEKDHFGDDFCPRMYKSPLLQHIRGVVEDQEDFQADKIFSRSDAMVNDFELIPIKNIKTDKMKRIS